MTFPTPQLSGDPPLYPYQRERVEKGQAIILRHEPSETDVESARCEGKHSVYVYAPGIDDQTRPGWIEGSDFAKSRCRVLILRDKYCPYCEGKVETHYTEHFPNLPKVCYTDAWGSCVQSGFAD